MIYREDIAFQIAQTLLKIEAVKLQPQNPFTWSSGWNSPIYCDNRKILSYPDARSVTIDSLTEVVKSLYLKAEYIAGVATGAIAHGALVAEKLNLPFIYVRASAKEHGMQNRVEGQLVEGSNVVVIEDLVSTGKSSISALNAIKQAGGNVLGLLSIFDYGFEEAKTNFLAAECEFYSLSDYQSLLQVANQQQLISASQLASLEEWRKDPANWNSNMPT